MKAVLGHLRTIVPNDEKNEFLFHMSSTINASIPLQYIRDWTAAIARDARVVAAPSLLFRPILMRTSGRTIWVDGTRAKSKNCPAPQRASDNRQ